MRCCLPRPHATLPFPGRAKAVLCASVPSPRAGTQLTFFLFSGHFKRLLVSCLNGARDETPTVNAGLASKDAKALFKAGEARWGTDESTFNAILASRSRVQLNATFDEYARIAGRSISDSIERETSGDLQDGLLALVASVRDMPGFFARKIHSAVHGLVSRPFVHVHCAVLPPLSMSPSSLSFVAAMPHYPPTEHALCPFARLRDCLLIPPRLYSLVQQSLKRPPLVHRVPTIGA